MAGVAGVFMRGGEVADAATVERMAALAPHRAAHGRWNWQDGPFAVTRFQTFCTPEDASERQPVVCHEPPAVLAFDGRIDNRLELADALAIDRADLQEISDAALALKGWITWREALPLKLLGDFALVAWDPVARLVFCATDTFALRPLYYFLSGRAFVFGTEPALVLANPLVRRTPDERGIGELLCGDPRTAGRTPYADVRRLPHAQALTVGPERERLWTYWTPEISVMRGGKAADYRDAFREQFDRSVKVRLRSAGPVGAHLSGGLDSSSVVATAVTLAPPPDLTAVSLAFDTPPADERRFADAVLEHAGLEGVKVVPPPFDPAEIRRQVRRRQYLPDFPNSWGATLLRGAMASRGIHVCLTGAGGDIGLAGSDFYLGELLKQGRFLAFTRRYRDMMALRGGHLHPVSIARCALWPALPHTVRSVLRPIARRFMSPSVPRWISPALARRTGLAEPRAAAPRASSAANATIARDYDDGLTHLVHDLYEIGSSEARIYDRHPFLDRRLVEFMLRLPDDQRWQQGQAKFVLREAMGDRLPDVVRRRSDRSKAEFSHVVDLALEAIGGRTFFEHLSIESAGWVVPGALAALHDQLSALRVLNDPAARDLAWQLWSAAAVEFWHSGVFGSHGEDTLWTTTATRLARSAGTLSGMPVECPTAVLS